MIGHFFENKMTGSQRERMASHANLVKAGEQKYGAESAVIVMSHSS